jgi:hypothetical protein
MLNRRADEATCWNSTPSVACAGISAPALRNLFFRARSASFRAMPTSPFQIHAGRAPLIALTLSLALMLTSPLAASSKTPAKPLPASVPVNLTVALAASPAEGPAPNNVEAPAPSNAVSPAPSNVEGPTLSNVEKPAPSDVEGPPLLVATLHNIVVQQKAGPWGVSSHWHEYVVSLADRGGIPLVIEAATLINARGEPVAPGDNPWVLANARNTWWERTDARGVMSPGRIAVSSVTVATMWPLMASPYAWCGWSWEAYGVGAAIIAPVYAANTIAFNVRGRKKIEADFQKRRLVLPLTIIPGQVVQGSLYFPVTLGPQRLALRCRAADQVRDLVLPLGSVADLARPPPHRAASSKTPPAHPNPGAKP